MKGIVSLGSIVSGAKSTVNKKSGTTKDSDMSLNIELHLDENGEPRIYDGHHRIMAMLSIGYEVTGVVHPTGDKYKVTIEDNQFTYIKL